MSNFEMKAINDNNEVSDLRLEKAYKVSARVVQLHGEKYLPIFERLHQELTKRKENKTLYSMAKEVAGNF